VAGSKVFGYQNVRVNSHVERRIIEEQAAVIRRIYEMYAAGAGLKVIAHTLNNDHAPCPRPRFDRVAGWCPSSIRMVLKQPLYRGEFLRPRQEA